MEDRIFRYDIGKFATGVTEITTKVDDVIHGMTANAFMSASMDLHLLCVS